MAQNKKSARAAVYMSDGFPLIVFDERLPGRNSFKGVRFNGQQFARVEVTESFLDGLKKQRFPDAQARNVLKAARAAGLVRFAGIPSGCRIVLESTSSGSKELNRQMSGLVSAVKNGKSPFFTRSGPVMQKKGAKEFFMFPPACVTDKGVFIPGMAQISAVTQCAVSGIPKHAGNLFILGKEENSNSSVKIRIPMMPKNISPSSSLNVFNSSPVVSGKLEKKVDELQMTREVKIGRAKRSGGEPAKFIDATDPNMSPVHFMACWMAASAAGIAIRTTDEVLDKMARKFGESVQSLGQSGRYSDFYMMYDGRLREEISNVAQDFVHKEEFSKVRDRVRSRGPSMGLGY